MSIFGNFFRGRNPTNMKQGKANNGSVLQMVNTYGNGYYRWNGKVYESDIVRACLRPKVSAIGKMSGKHIKKDPDGLMVVNAEPRLRFLLEDPNPYMTGQQLQEKLVTQLDLNGNAFALLIRDQNGLPTQVYPIPGNMVEAIYDDQGSLFLRFTFPNGNRSTFDYEDIIHLRKDFNENEIFGTSPMAALSQLLECVGVIDQGIVKAIKNSNIIRWLLQFQGVTRPEDIKKQTKDFAESYLSYDSETFGVAAVDQKVEAKQVQPTDIMPNALTSDRLTERIFSFFNTNKDIVQSSYDEDQWTSYYEAAIAPVVIQLSQVYTNRLLSRRERAMGQKIVFESASLEYASMHTKLGLTQFLDRGIMNANEIRAILSLPAIPGGDEYVRRLDTAPITGKVSQEGQTQQPEPTEEEAQQTTTEGGVENESRYPRRDHSE